jgi:hypothetical protein
VTVQGEPMCNCGWLLAPTQVNPGDIPNAAIADFVCEKCGRAYRWTGVPRRLVPALSVVARRSEGKP